MPLSKNLPPHLKFNSAALTDVMADVGDTLAGFQQNLDRVSDDIKSLEAFLVKSAINLRIELEVRECILQFQGKYEFGGGLSEQIDGCPVDIVREFLVWDRDKNGNFRLQYQRCIHDGYMDLDGALNRPYQVEALPKEHEIRPLIECKIEVRISMREHLPKFISEFAARLRPLSALSNHTSMTDQLSGLAQVVESNIK